MDREIVERYGEIMKKKNEKLEGGFSEFAEAFSEPVEVEKPELEQAEEKVSDQIKQETLDLGLNTFKSAFSEP